AASTAPSRKGRVMIIENEEIIRRLMRELLSGGHEVETFASGREALECFGPGDWDVAIIDLGMPGIPGDQIARQIKLMDSSVATVLLTGWRLADSDPRLSAFDFRLQKPVNLDDVENTVLQAIRLHDSKTGVE
ncbi:MAG: response regulator, partial [Chloroflexi bacterium]|nr:response regulator [Chloroflexota bacterium]